MSRSSKRDERLRISTRLKLATALRAAHAPAAMIAAAERGLYDAVHSTIMDPLTALIHDAHKEGLDDIAVRAEAGEWREQVWERQEWLEESGVAAEVRAWNTLERAIHQRQSGQQGQEGKSR